VGVWREIFHFPFLRVAAARLLFYFPLSAVGASAISLARLHLIIYGSGRVQVESKEKTDPFSFGPYPVRSDHRAEVFGTSPIHHMVRSDRVWIGPHFFYINFGRIRFHFKKFGPSPIRFFIGSKKFGLSPAHALIGSDRVRFFSSGSDRIYRIE